jgi:hypothetical protein
VSHDPRIIPMVDRVYHMEDGRLHDQDEPHGHAGSNGSPTASSSYPALH